MKSSSTTDDGRVEGPGRADICTGIFRAQVLDPERQVLRDGVLESTTEDGPDVRRVARPSEISYARIWATNALEMNVPIEIELGNGDTACGVNKELAIGYTELS